VTLSADEKKRRGNCLEKGGGCLTRRERPGTEEGGGRGNPVLTEPSVKMEKRRDTTST